MRTFVLKQLYRGVGFSIAVLLSSLSCAETITSQSLYLQTQQINQTLEAIRVYMGKPKAQELPITVENSTIWDVYFHSMELHRRAGQLGFEVYLRHSPKMPLPQLSVTHTDVSNILSETLQILQRVSDRLDIDNDSKLSRGANFNSVSNQTELAALTQTILLTTRQLDQMLERRVTPSDVFLQTEIATQIAEQLSQLVGITDPLKSAPFVPNKQPRDVFKRQFDCLQLLIAIENITNGMTAGIKISTSANLDQHLAPAEVIQMAEQNHATLRHIYHYALNRQNKPIPNYEVPFPGRKFPSHVFQQTERLYQRLERLHAYTKTNPNWFLDITPTQQGHE